VTKWNNSDPSVRTVSYEGRVLNTGSRERKYMSDVYAIEYYAVVWDDKTQAPMSIPVSSNFELVRENGTAVVDADEATLAAYRAWQAEKQAAEEKLLRELLRERTVKGLIQQHNKADIGKKVVVLRGRKVPKGTVGIVFWLRDGRAGVRTSDRKEGRNWADVVWVDVDYLGNIDGFNLRDHMDPSEPHFQEMEAYAQSLIS